MTSGSRCRPLRRCTRRPCACLAVVSDVFPRTAANDLPLQGWCVVHLCVIDIVGSQIPREVIHCFIVGGVGPLGDVATHVVQAIVVGAVRLHWSGVGISIFYVVTPHRLEIGQDTALLVACVWATPRERGKVTSSTGGIFPLCFRRQSEALDICFVVLLLPFVHDLGAPSVEGFACPM